MYFTFMAYTNIKIINMVFFIFTVDGKVKCPHCVAESIFKSKPYETKFNKALEARQGTLFTRLENYSRCVQVQ